MHTISNNYFSGCWCECNFLWWFDGKSKGRGSNLVKFYCKVLLYPMSWALSSVCLYTMGCISPTAFTKQNGALRTTAAHISVYFSWFFIYSFSFLGSAFEHMLIKRFTFAWDLQGVAPDEGSIAFSSSFLEVATAGDFSSAFVWVQTHIEKF